MTTITKPLARFRALLRLKKSNADDNIERHEPDRIFPIFQDFVVGLFLTGFLMMFTYAFMNGSMAEWIGTYLAHNVNGTYDERLAIFTSACVALVSLVVIFGIALNREASNDDIVEVTNDQSDELNERFAEIEDRLAGKIDGIQKSIDDLTLAPIDEPVEITEQIGG